MSSNRRIFYAIEQIALAPIGTTTFTSSHVVHGAQSVGINTRFSLEQVFELGQISIYSNQETTPEVEVTLEKGLDGNALIYHLATPGAISNSINGRCGATKAQFAMSIFPDTQDSASGTSPVSTVFCSGVYVSSVAYHFPVEGISTEQVTLVGNNKLWGATGITFNGFATNTDAPAYGSGISRRWDISYTGVAPNNTYTVLPSCIEGMSSSGVNNTDANGNYAVHVQNIRTSVNLGREQMHELGRRAAYFRYVQFPCETRTEIEVMGVSGDQISALETGINADGTNQPAGGYTIKIKSKEGIYIDLGNTNKLESVSYGGGNAGGRGGNVTETYTFQSWNDFTVGHPADPMALGGY